MNQTGRFLIAAALSGALTAPAVLAQSTQAAQNQQSQPSQDQYSGISHPPPDSSIQADEDAQPAQPRVVPPARKPSAGVPVTAPATAAAPAAARTTGPAAQPEDPDYGIVTSTPATAEAAGAKHGKDWDPDYGIVTSVPQSPELHKRGAFNPNDDIVNVVPNNPNELAAGTNIRVRLSQSLSTTTTQEGSAFRGVVAHDVYKDGKVIIPAGSEMRGRVVFVSQGHHVGPHARLRLRPDYVILPDGTAYHLYASVIRSKAPGTRTTNEGGIEASNHYTKDALEYGGGVGAGAAAGAVVAGPIGAGVGSLVGAGLVTTHLLLQSPQEATLPEGSELVFSLTEPMGLTPARN